MTWWAWMIGGAILLGAELAFVDAQFYLVFIGSAAIVVGIASAGVPAIPDWIQWAGFGALCLASMVGFRRRVYARLRGRTPALATGNLDSILELPQALAPEESCRIEHAGSFWTVLNDGDQPLARGARVRVARVDGLTLRVRAQT